MDTRCRQRSIGLIGLCLALLAAFLGTPHVPMMRADITTETVSLRYVIDRSALPAWVTFRDLTLVIDAPGAESVSAWGDGQPLPIRHDAAAGQVTVTTAASELLLTLQGAGMQAAEMGAYRVATLREDKLWAYSLTFDDGEFTVYQHALPELRRYGFRAGVAVIGQWLDRDDANDYGYCGVPQFSELLDEGWSIFNHSYMHFNDDEDITLEDAQRCQTAIHTRLNGYRATVFTVPYTDARWSSIIDQNAQTLGLYLMQLSSNTGARLHGVDGPITLTSAAYHLGRDDIKDWNRDGYNYFDQAHEAATAATPEHTWVSLHAHNMNYEEDWCAVAESASYLYHHYGAGGADEVWVAPADEVFQYLVTRSYATVARTGAVPGGPVSTWFAPRLVSYRQGEGGYTGWRDTHIQEWYPDTNYVTQGQMLLRGGVGGRSSLLMRFDVTPPDGWATVLRAELSFYVSSPSWDMSLSIYPLLRGWDPAQATWRSALTSTPWALPGALASAEDRADQPVDVVHMGICSGVARWYTVDVTDLVADWLAHPENNHGLVIAGPDEIAKGVMVTSANNPSVAYRPALRIVYAWAEPSPTPTATETPTYTPTPTESPTQMPTYTPTPAPTGRQVFLPLLHR